MPSSVLERDGFRSTARDRRFLVGLVDVSSVIALLAVGSITHGVSPLHEPLEVAETITPFAAAWIVVAPLAGCYAHRVLESARRATVVTTVAWLAAANVGLILRSSPAFEGGARWPFNLIVTCLGLLVLVTWRVAYARVAGAREAEGRW